MANFSVGQANLSQKIRAVDSAVNYLKARLGFPQDEKKYSFYFCSDTLFYTAPSDFQEVIGLFYNNSNLNADILGRSWEYRPYQELLPKTGQYPSRQFFSHTTFNGSHQLFLLGNNTYGGQTYETFDSTVWTASGDASGAANDTVIKYEGGGSMKFNLTYSTGTATLTSPTVNWDLSQLIANSGFIKFFMYFTAGSGAVLPTNVKLQYGTNGSNYYTQTVTAAEDGTAFTNNAWNKLLFNTATAVQTGTPTNTSITFFKILITLPASFGTATNFRVDDLYSTYPDYLDLIYLSNVKGTDVNGTDISKFTAASDIILYDYDFIEPISIQAALYIYPQLRADLNWRQLMKSDLEEVIKIYARRWPRKRIENNFTRTVLRR